MSAPTQETFREQLVRVLGNYEDASIPTAYVADGLIRMWVERLTWLVLQLDADDPACALLRAEIRDIQAGAR